MIRHPFTFYNTKKNNAACDWQQIGILSRHKTNSTNFLNIKLGTHFIVISGSAFVSDFLWQYCVPYLCQPKKKSFTSKPRSPNPVGTLGGVPFQRSTPRANACGFNMSTTWIHQWSVGSLFKWLDPQELRSCDKTWSYFTKRNSSTTFGVCFPRLILIQTYIF